MSEQAENAGSQAGKQKDGRIKDDDMKEVNLQVNEEQTGKSNEGKYEIKVTEKKGLLRSAIPRVQVPIAWLVLFFNVFLPGTGTLILSLFSLCGVPTDLKKQNFCLAFLINLLTAFLQMITAVIIIGWIWSVYWGMFAVTEANERSENLKKQKKMEKAQAASEEANLKDNAVDDNVV
ncbi:protein stum homolog [Styela clava]|uniref:protein stum homolog n=1 Tax=Styela clava TaxID=7725 RepID=UPI00193A949B|nr:protein stum homolog [Styela clava]